jgi:hypothetical protein
VTKPTDVLHLVVYLLVVVASVVLVAAHVVPVATVLAALIAWAGPSAGGALGRLLAGLQPPADGASGGGPAVVATTPPLAVPFSARPPPPDVLSPRRVLELVRRTFVWPVVALALAACGGHITPADSAVVASQVNEETDCVSQFKPDRDAIDACRAKVRARFDAYWAAKFADGGTP